MAGIGRNQRGRLEQVLNIFDNFYYLREIYCIDRNLEECSYIGTRN